MPGIDGDPTYLNRKSQSVLTMIGCGDFFFFQAEDGIRDYKVTGVQTCALPISQSAERTLKALYGVAVLDGLGQFTRAELSAAGALVAYLELTQKGKFPALKSLKQIGRASCRERV